MNSLMQSCNSFYVSSRQNKKQEIKISQIDFNKVLHLINEEIQTQFLQTRRKKLYYQTERNKRPYFFHSRCNSRGTIKFENKAVIDEINKELIRNLNKNFIENQSKFRASFPIRRNVKKECVEQNIMVFKYKNQRKELRSGCSRIELRERSYKWVKDGIKSSRNGQSERRYKFERGQQMIRKYKWQNKMSSAISKQMSNTISKQMSSTMSKQMSNKTFSRCKVQEVESNRNSYKQCRNSYKKSRNQKGLAVVQKYIELRICNTPSIQQSSKSPTLKSPTHNSPNRKFLNQKSLNHSQTMA